MTRFSSFGKGALTLFSLFVITSQVYAVTYDSNAPTAPADVTAVAYTSPSAKVVLNWKQAMDNIGVTRYNIYRNGTFMISPVGVGVTYTDTTVVAGKTYTYTIQAGDGDGNNGPQSQTAEITVAEGSMSRIVTPQQIDTQAPSTSTAQTFQQVTSVYGNISSSVNEEKVKHPSGVTLSIVNEYLAIGWDAPQKPIKSIRVIKKESSFPISVMDGKIICDSFTLTQCIDKESSPGKTYYYGVYSVDDLYLTSAIVTVSGTLPEKKKPAPVATLVTTKVPSIVVSSPKVEQSVPATSSYFTKTLKLGSVGQDVLLLQKFLNTNGFAIAESGPGSKGNETQTFGRATENALKAYQCKKSIVCEGNPSSTGYGMVGKTTRYHLNQDLEKKPL